MYVHVTNISRFNPNLYADGKVCLSLLGTWHGGDATEKWDPQTCYRYGKYIFLCMFNEPDVQRTRLRGYISGDQTREMYVNFELCKLSVSGLWLA